MPRKTATGTDGPSGARDAANTANRPATANGNAADARRPIADLAAAVARTCAAGAVVDRAATAIGTIVVPDTCATAAATVRDAARPGRGRMQPRAGDAVLVRLGRAADALTLVAAASAADGLTLVAVENAADGLTLVAAASVADGLTLVAAASAADGLALVAAASAAGGPTLVAAGAGGVRVVFAEARAVVRKADSRGAVTKASAVRDTVPPGRGRGWRTAEVTAVVPRESRAAVAAEVKDVGHPCGAADSADRRAVVRT